jgi:hypothetical protein
MDRRDDNLTTADLADSTPPSEVEHEAPEPAEEAAQVDDERASSQSPEADSEGMEGPEEPTETEERDKAPASMESTQEQEADGESESTALLPGDQASEFQGRWETLQTGFVDEPRRAVEDADALVAELMQRLASSFSDERSALEEQWDRGDDVSTEDLRVALQRYRSFFERLLSA